MRQVIPNVYTFANLLAGRVYLLRDDDGLTIVDASISIAGNRILNQLKEAGHQPSDVKRILITHAHPDHVGALPQLVEATGAEVWCHALEKPVVQGEIPVPSRQKGIRTPAIKFKPVPVAKTIEDGEVLPIFGGLQVVGTPGHAPGHLSFWHPEGRWIITGDVIFHMLNRMSLPFAIVTVDMDENKRSIRKVVNLKPDTMMFGHGLPIVGNAMEKLEAFAKRIGV